MAEYICPHCKKSILDDDALRCIYCGELLNRRIGFLSDIKYSRVATVFILILLLSFIVFFIIRL
jgi:phage FluMu protein Com